MYNLTLCLTKGREVNVAARSLAKSHLNIELPDERWGRIRTIWTRSNGQNKYRPNRLISWRGWGPYCVDHVQYYLFIYLFIVVGLWTPLYKPGQAKPLDENRCSQSKVAISKSNFQQRIDAVRRYWLIDWYQFINSRRCNQVTQNHI